MRVLIAMMHRSSATIFGKRIALVAVSGDPPRDVTLLERPAALIKGGALVKGANGDTK